MCVMCESVCIYRYIWMCKYRWEQRSWNVQGWRGLIILRQRHRHHRFATAEFSFVFSVFPFCLSFGFFFFLVICLFLFLFVYLVWENFVKWEFHDWGSMAIFFSLFIFQEYCNWELRLLEGKIAYSLNYDIHVRLIIIER